MPSGKRRPASESQSMQLREQLEDPFEAEPGVGDFFGGWNPAVDILEDKNKLTVKAELPGFKREDLDVSVQGEFIILSGERKYENEQNEGGFYRSERFYGKFHRSVPLPFPVDASKIEAHYQDGVLTVTMPKREQAKAKQIPVAG